MAEVRRVLTLLVALAFCGCDQLDQRLPFETPRAPTKSGGETEDNPRPKRPVGTELPQPKMEYWIIWPSGEVTTFEEYLIRNNVRRYTPAFRPATCFQDSSTTVDLASPIQPRPIIPLMIN